MKKLLSLLFVTIFFFSINIFAQDLDAQKSYMDFMTPGPVHKQMEKFVGNWNVKMSMWMTPDAPPSISEGTCVYEMIMGGRYLQSKYSSVVMGMPMSGLSIEGYDNAKKVFNNLWIDNMGTGFTIAQGTLDETTRILSYLGTTTDPITKTDSKYRETFQMVDDDHIIMEMFMYLPDGKEYKNIRVEFERAK